MNKLLIGSALAIFSLASCGKKTAADSATPQTGPTTSESAPAPQVAAQAPVVPEARLFSTPGTFFLVKSASLETDSGLFNFRPGTKVSRVGNRYVTPDGRQLTLRADQITNDLRVAQQVAGNDPRLQTVIQAAIQTAQRLQANAPKVAPAKQGLASE